MLLSLFALALVAQAPAAPPSPEADFGHPVWVETPSPADVAETYPSSAYASGQTASVALICRASLAGRLNDCQVISDTAPGAGFDQASLELARHYRMKALGSDGRPMIGRLVRLSVGWKAPKVFRADNLPYDPVPLDRVQWTGRVRPTKPVGEVATVRLVCRITASGKLAPCAEPGARKPYDGPAKWTVRKFTAAPLDVDGKPTRGKLVVLEFPDVKSKLP